MTSPTSLPISVIGDFVVAIRPVGPPALQAPTGHALIPSGDERIAIAVSGAVRHGIGADGTHWLAVADLIEGDVAAGVAAYAGNVQHAAWRGRFVQLLWQPARARLVALTDHFSTLPLYTFRHEDTFYMASDLRLLSALPGCARSVDMVAVYHYLNFGCIPAPTTICKEIRRVEPGTRLIWDKGVVDGERYFLPEYAEDRVGDDESLARDLLAHIDTSVTDYRPDDSNRWGCFLSGGTDSSSIVSLLARMKTGRTVRTFSIGFAEPGYDELDYARLAAEACGALPETSSVSRAQSLELIEKIVAAYDQPFGNASSIPTLACANLAAGAGTDVLLGGDGGDEIFGGNQRYAKDQVMETFHALPAFMKSIGRSIGRLAGRSSSHLLHRVQNFVERGSLPNPDRFYTDDSFASDYYNELLTPAFRAHVDADASLELMRGVYALGAPASPLHRIMRLDLLMAIAQNDVVKVHGACKAAGISSRFPFLDPALVAYTGRLPQRYKVRGLDKRYLFKRAMSSVLPRATLKKKKQGFGLPIAVWLREDAAFQDAVRGVLSDPITQARGWFNLDFVERLIGEHLRGVWDHSAAIWSLMILELWLRKHLDAR